jgi:hypothetical protein
MTGGGHALSLSHAFHDSQGAAGIVPAEEAPCRRDVGSTLLAAIRDIKFIKAFHESTRLQPLQEETGLMHAYAYTSF